MSDIFMTTVPRRGLKIAPSTSTSSWSSTTSGGGGTPLAPEVGGASSVDAGGSKVASYVYAIPAVIATAALVASTAKLFMKSGGGADRRGSPPRRGGDLAASPIDTGASPKLGRKKSASKRGETAKSPTEGGRFVKEKMIGRGAFGAVYKGMDRETGEIIAIKEMDSAAANELKQEFDMLKGLRHEHVVCLHGFETVGPKARLYLEWVASGSLSDVMAKHGKVNEMRLRNYVRQLLLGLQFLHNHGILHRDIKPKNILVDHRGILKLTDFGLSRHLNSINPTTRPCGTPIYMAPECIKGQFTIGSDLWALGASVVELASGELPWSHLEDLDNNYALMYHIGNLAGQRGHHPLIPPHLSDEAKDFLLQCFAPLAENRGSCDSLLAHPFVVQAGSPLRDSITSCSSPKSVPSAAVAPTHDASVGTSAPQTGTSSSETRTYTNTNHTTEGSCRSRPSAYDEEEYLEDEEQNPDELVEATTSDEQGLTQEG